MRFRSSPKNTEEFKKGLEKAKTKKEMMFLQTNLQIEEKWIPNIYKCKKISTEIKIVNGFTEETIKGVHKMLMGYL